MGQCGPPGGSVNVERLEIPGVNFRAVVVSFINEFEDMEDSKHEVESLKFRQRLDMKLHRFSDDSVLSVGCTTSLYA